MKGFEWIKNNGWKLVEEPKAYTWDPEMEKIYESMNINHEMKDSHYTSVHYVIKPDNDYNDVCWVKYKLEHYLKKFGEKWTILLIILQKRKVLLVTNNLKSHGETS